MYPEINFENNILYTKVGLKKKLYKSSSRQFSVIISVLIKKLSTLGNKVKRSLSLKMVFSLINHRGTFDNSKAWRSDQSNT